MSTSIVLQVTNVQRQGGPGGSIEISWTRNGEIRTYNFGGEQGMIDAANAAVDDDHILALLLSIWYNRFGFSPSKDDEIKALSFLVKMDALVSEVTTL